MPNTTPNLGKNFYIKLNKMCERLNVNPADMLLLMYLESNGLDPAAVAKSTGASGLNQFMPSTLKDYFSGSIEEYRKLSGEDQLDYIEKFFEKSLKGKNITSSAQLYIANYLPTRANLSGVQDKIKETPLCQRGSDFYEKNSGLDANHDGVITYGDIENILAPLSQKPGYLAALKKLQEAAGKEYEPEIKSSESGSEPDEADSILQKFINKLIESLESFSREVFASTNSHVLIKISSPNLENNLELARLLSTAYEDFLSAKCKTYTNKKDVEIVCSAKIPLSKTYLAIKQFSKVASQQFCKITNINDINVKIFANKEPSYSGLDLKTSQINYRKFQIKLIGKTNGRHT